MNSASDLFIVDNSDSDWKVRSYLQDWCELSSAIDIATGYFEIGALLALAEKWRQVDRIRILMGDEVSLRTKAVFTQGLQKINGKLDDSLEHEKRQNDFLSGVPAIVEAIRGGKIQCRIYRKDKFLAKAYLTHGRAAVIGSFGLVGSSNLTYPGLCDNIELNVQIRGPEVRLLQEWYERHWNEAEDVTPDILQTLERHTREYTPFDVWTKALDELMRGHELTPDEWDRRHSAMFPILARYQQDAYKNLIQIANRFGMAFLGDGVGLGKTFVGLMLLERMVVREGKRVVLFAPKAAREDVWERAIGKYLPGLNSRFVNFVLFNHTDLQRKGHWPRDIELTLRDADIVILDEAQTHNLDLWPEHADEDQVEAFLTEDHGGTVWIDAGGARKDTRAGTCGFRGVPAAVWQFHVGGYQVCEKWLKDRKGRTLTDDELIHYQRVVVALHETLRLMAAIDAIIDQHGGWPGAFQTAAAAAAT